MIQQSYTKATLYLSSNKNAPTSSQVANSLGTILKACLVTGYGDKPPAGWILLFEDTAKNTKVFRSPASTERSFDVRVVDNGKSATVQVCFDMASIDDVSNLKLQCATPFKYNVAVPTGRWALIATNRGFWFFNELQHGNAVPINQSGTYIFCGDTCGDSAGRKAIYIKHSGGAWADTDDDRDGIFMTPNGNSETSGVIYDFIKNNTVNVNPSVVLFNGSQNITTNVTVTQMVLLANSNIWRLPAYVPSRNDKKNYDLMSIDGLALINHATSTRFATALNDSSPTNLYIPTNWWIN